ncbi:hypothetical protein Nepgr_005665 [Nepenthes gracilis]|uniref:Uncharacterized protein n=1 Tax=Nepenthes gracilis TaxID=150966 RepID=A0AAD3XGT7_NEPGR|nr:hypothetical protein Nepgr_005665 [Nepenthes gracilis]
METVVVQALRLAFFANENGSAIPPLPCASFRVAAQLAERDSLTSSEYLLPFEKAFGGSPPRAVRCANHGRGARSVALRGKLGLTPNFPVLDLMLLYHGGLNYETPTGMLPAPALIRLQFDASRRRSPGSPGRGTGAYQASHYSLLSSFSQLHGCRSCTL